MNLIYGRNLLANFGDAEKAFMCTIHIFVEALLLITLLLLIHKSSSIFSFIPVCIIKPII